MENKKGQLTIFIIVAILIVTGIVAMFWLMGNSTTEAPADLNPKQFVQKCVRDAVEDSVDKMFENGGQRVPSQAIAYQGHEWNYLCYQEDYYQGCYNLHPMLEFLIEEEIKEDTKDEVQACFDDMREDLDNKGFDISGGATEYSINLMPGNVEINLKKRVDVVRGESSQSFNDFSTEILSPMYELMRIAREVVNSESQFCHFEYNGYMLLYPEYEIRRIDYSDSKIYTLTDRRTGAQFKMAVRSCAFAPGL